MMACMGVGVLVRTGRNLCVCTLTLVLTRPAPRVCPQLLLLLKLMITDHDNLFVLSELSHFSGIGFLMYKLTRVESCEGASRLALSLARHRVVASAWSACASAAASRPSLRRRHLAEESGADRHIPGHPTVLQVRERFTARAELVSTQRSPALAA